MVKVMVFVPEVEKVIPEGFSAEEVAGDDPLPKSQENTQPVPVLPVLVKSTGEPTQAGAVELKLAVGCG